MIPAEIASETLLIHSDSMRKIQYYQTPAVCLASFLLEMNASAGIDQSPKEVLQLTNVAAHAELTAWAPAPGID